MTVVGPEYVEYISAANALLADTSLAGTATFVVSDPGLALPGGSTTAGLLVYNVTSPSQVRGAPAAPSGCLQMCRMHAGASSHGMPPRAQHVLRSPASGACLRPGLPVAHARHGLHAAPPCMHASRDGA